MQTPRRGGGPCTGWRPAWAPPASSWFCTPEDTTQLTSSWRITSRHGYFGSTTRLPTAGSPGWVIERVMGAFFPLSWSIKYSGAFSVFLLCGYKQIQNSDGNMLARVWWYRFFCYLERNTGGGPVPRKYQSPIPFARCCRWLRFRNRRPWMKTTPTCELFNLWKSNGALKAGNDDGSLGKRCVLTICVWMSIISNTVPFFSFLPPFASDRFPYASVSNRR